MYHGGTIAVRGNFANGIYAAGNSATVTTDPGTTITVLSVTGERLKPGVALDSFGTAAANHALTATVASTIQMLGPAAPDPGLRNNGYGIRAFSFLDAPISVNYIGPGITTIGGNGMGIVALSGGGSVNVTASGPITTHGSGAVGIFVDSTNLVASSPSEFRPTPFFTGVPTGTVQVNATNVSTTGQFSSGIVAKGAREVTVNIASGGSVMGGWQADLTGGSDLFNLPAAGVILKSTGGVATLVNDGTIGALSDRAVFGDPLIFNNGMMTGFVQFTTGVNEYFNNGTFNLRHFADTNGDGTRDTLRVALSDLGSGASNVFTNNGTLALLGGAGATTLDTSGQYLPLGTTANAMTLGGPVQGHLLGVATFTNTGTINLQANPVPGDVLLISGGHTPGSNGGGTFISNGGRLLIDTVLDAGGPGSRSDVLVIDNAIAGAGGATTLSVKNFGGLGALTVGDGILVVQAPNGGTTAKDAFALGGIAAAGAFDYLLFRGGVTPGSENNWFLRSTAQTSPPIPPSPPTSPPPSPPTSPPTSPPPSPPTSPPPVPLFRPEAALYTKVPLIARQTMLFTLGTFHERRGDQFLVQSSSPFANRSVSLGGLGSPSPGSPQVASTFWGRTYGQQLEQRWAGALSPEFSGHMIAAQIGADLVQFEAGAHTDRAGVFYAFADTDGEGRGFIRAVDRAVAGNLNMNSHNIGAYWTHIGPSQWYVDAVLMGTFFNTDTRSNRGIAANLHGDGITASIEAGVPVRFTPYLTLEAQGQLIWQRLQFDPASDPFTTLKFGLDDSFIGRFGLRLEGETWLNGVRLQPFVQANLWRAFGGTDSTVFNGVFTLPTSFEGTSLEISGGVTAKLADKFGVYARGSYATNVGGNFRETIGGQLGMRVTW